MDFDLSEEERMIQAAAREFAEREMRPLAAEIDRNKRFPKDTLLKMAPHGFLGMLIPEKYGGSEMSNVALALVGAEFNRVCASTGVSWSVHTSLSSGPLARHGNEAQKSKYLPKLARGEMMACYALTEPGSGSDASALETRAVREGDHYVINGAKAFITNGTYADLILLYARTDPDRSLKSKGISAFLVEKKTPGIRVGKPEDKMGICGSDTVALYFENCHVGAENLVGEEGKGFRIALETLDGGRIGIAAQAVGIAQACLEASLKYVQERKQFGKTLAEFQAIQFKLAEMAVELDAARLLTYRAARVRDLGKPHTKEASMAKLFASTIANKAAREAVQIHGGVGYTKDFPVERYFRDARITEIYEGTSEVQKIVIARELLGKKK